MNPTRIQETLTPLNTLFDFFFDENASWYPALNRSTPFNSYHSKTNNQHMNYQRVKFVCSNEMIYFHNCLRKPALTKLLYQAKSFSYPTTMEILVLTFITCYWMICRGCINMKNDCIQVSHGIRNILQNRFLNKRKKVKFKNCILW